MERLWADAEAAYRREILASLPVDASVRLLDVGCEDGAWTERLRTKVGIPAGQVSGLEIVPELAARSRERGFEVRTGDLDAPWPFADAAFDIVHANQVIEHVQIAAREPWAIALGFAAAAWAAINLLLTIRFLRSTADGAP